MRTRGTPARFWLVPADFALATACYAAAAWFATGLDFGDFLMDGGALRAAMPAALALAAAVHFQELRREGRRATRLGIALELELATGAAFLAQAAIHLLGRGVACPLPVMLAGSLLAAPALFCSRLLAGAARAQWGLSVIACMDRAAGPPAWRAVCGREPDSLPAPLIVRLAAGSRTPPDSRPLGAGRAAIALVVAAPLLLLAAVVGAAHPGAPEIE